MNRRDTAFALLALGAAPLASRAQQRRGIRRIAYPSLRPGPNQFEHAFVRGMRERGYVDGTNVVIDYRWAGGDVRREEAMAAEVVASGPDLVFAPEGFTVRTLRTLSPSLPIVIPAMADPIAAGLTRSISRPDGNVTGLAVFAEELSRKRLELFKEALPGLKRVGALFNGARSTPPPGPIATHRRRRGGARARCRAGIFRPQSAPVAAPRPAVLWQTAARRCAV